MNSKKILCKKVNDYEVTARKIKGNVYKVEVILDKVLDLPSLSITDAKQCENAKVVDDKLVCACSSLTINDDGSISVFDKDGNVIYGEKSNVITKRDYEIRKDSVPSEFAKFSSNKNMVQYDISFDFEADEAIYGLGANRNKSFNIKDESFDLYQQNTLLPIPLMVSSKGYGVFFDEYSMMFYNAKEHKFTVDCSMQPRYYIILGSYQQIIKTYRNLTGGVSLLPKWSFGFTQSKERYKSAREVKDVIDKHIENEIPVSMVVQDWQYWTFMNWGLKKFRKSYGNAKKMVQYAHEKDVKLMISVWPRVTGHNNKDKREFKKHDMLFKKTYLDVSPAKEKFTNRNYYNAFKKEARDVFFEQFYDGIGKYNFDAYWLDNCEPLASGYKEKDYSIELYRQIFDRRFANTYPFFHNVEFMKKLKKMSNKRQFIMTRCSHPAMQKENITVWTGDIDASYEVLRQQLNSMLNYVMTGNAYINFDIGGFFLNGKQQSSDCKDSYPLMLEDKGYCELFVRWMQVGAFVPMMRSHGTHAARELWLFDQPYRQIAENYVKLRHQLIPYIYTTAYDVTNNYASMIKPLVLDYPTDQNVQNKGDEFMFGDNILVCPILNAMYWDVNNTKIDEPQKVSVYLPEGKWYNYHTNEAFEGAQEYELETSLENIPVFIKDNSIIPMMIDDKLTFKVYGEGEKRCSFYDDDGESYKYQDGEFCLLDVQSKGETLEITQVDGKIKFDEVYEVEFIK